MTLKCSIGLIGAGWMGSEHGRNILKNPDSELVAIADESKDNSEKFQKENDIDITYYKDYHRLLERSDIDAVIISTPNNTHKEISIAAAKAGKHIYCEKPMAITLDDCWEIKEEVLNSKVKYLIGYHRRFNPLYQYVKKLQDNGKLGESYYIESDYIHYVPPDWPIFEWLGKENIAGSIFHAGCGHNIDLIRFFMGDAEEVFCFKDICHPRKIQIETEDSAIAVIKFKNGAMGKCFLGFGAITPFSFDFNYYCTKATIKNNKIWFDSIPEFYETGHEDDCITLPQSWIPDNVQGGVSETWDKSIDHFVDAIVNDKPTLNDAESAFKTCEIVFAILDSAKNKKVISL